MKVVCITNDVEATTVQGESYREDVAQQVEIEAVPKTLALYRRMGIKATFFCLGQLIESHPDIVRMIQQDGHEVACHGLVHDSDKAFDVLSLDEQIQHLSIAKKIIENVSTKPVVSFRAPALRVNEYTAMALKQTGFKYDSSVSPQRLDAFMSLGSKKKLQWIFAPRTIYECAENTLARVGHSGIREIPVSAFGAPYISTLMRVSPFLCVITRLLLFLETRCNNQKVVCFLFHPGELMNKHENTAVVRRSKNPIVHFFTGILRSKLKQRNFGDKCIQLFEREINFWKRHGYEFKTINQL